MKKWRPPKRSSLLVADAMSPMGREEVLEAKMVLAGASESYS